MGRLRTFAAAIKEVIQLRCPGTYAPAHVSSVMFDSAHALDTAREYNVAGAGLNHHRGGDDGLEATAAAPIKLKPGHLDGESGLERDPSTDARRFAIGVRLCEYRVFDQGRVYSGALQHRLDDDRSEDFHRDITKRAAESADGGSQWAENGGGAHQ